MRRLLRAFLAGVRGATRGWYWREKEDDPYGKPFGMPTVREHREDR